MKAPETLHAGATRTSEFHQELAARYIHCHRRFSVHVCNKCRRATRPQVFGLKELPAMAWVRQSASELKSPPIIGRFGSGV